MCGTARNAGMSRASLLLLVACSSAPAAQGPEDAGAQTDAAVSRDASFDAVLDAPALDATTDASLDDAPSADATDARPYASTFTDPFDTFDTSLWACEYSCPTIQNGAAAFTLLPNIAPDKDGSWSKIRYKPHRFTSGRFTVRFALSARPKRAVWWGVALWDDGPNPDQSQFNEINFGYTTDESFTSTQMLFESAKLGHGASIKVDTGVNLYDGTTHTGVLEYDASHVSLYFDGTLLQTITDTTEIPTDALDFLLGPRLVTGSAALTDTFVESVDSATLEW